MDYCNLILRIKEMSGMNCPDFCLKVLQCGTTHYTRIISHKIDPSHQIVQNSLNFIERKIKSNNDDLIDVLFCDKNIAIKLNEKINNNYSFYEISKNLNDDVMYLIIKTFINELKQRNNLIDKDDLLKTLHRLLDLSKGEKNQSILIQSVIDALNK